MRKYTGKESFAVVKCKIPQILVVRHGLLVKNPRKKRRTNNEYNRDSNPNTLITCTHFVTSAVLLVTQQPDTF